MAPVPPGNDWRERMETHERHEAAEWRYLKAGERHISAMATSVQLCSLNEDRAWHAADGAAFADRAAAATLTLMALRPKVDGRAAALIDAAVAACDEVASCALALAGQDDCTYLWLNDLREIEELVAAIYAHVNAPDGPDREAGQE